MGRNRVKRLKERSEREQHQSVASSGASSSKEGPSTKQQPENVVAKAAESAENDEPRFLDCVLSSNQEGLVSLWNLQTGETLLSLKTGGPVSRHCLSFLGCEYIYSALKTKPIVDIWEAVPKEAVHHRSIMAAPVTAMAVAPNGQVCVGCIGEKIHVWKIENGKILVVLTRHFQRVNVIRFSDCSTGLVSGGEDGLMCGWAMEAVLGPIAGGIQENQGPEPRHVWRQHNLPVTDVKVGAGPRQICRVFSVSLDQTAKVFRFETGELLLSVVFPTALGAVTIDPLEKYLVVGTQEGQIHLVNLHAPPRTLDHYFSEEEKLSSSLTGGHEKAVSALDFSWAGDTLVSASEDGSVATWSLTGRTRLRSFPIKAGVTNASCHRIPHLSLPRRKRRVAALSRAFEDPKDGQVMLAYCRKRTSDLLEECEPMTTSTEESTTVDSAEELKRARNETWKMYTLLTETML